MFKSDIMFKFTKYKNCITESNSLNYKVSSDNPDEDKMDEDAIAERKYEMLCSYINPGKIEENSFNNTVFKDLPDDIMV